MIENRTITIAQLKSIQVLMTDADRKPEENYKFIQEQCAEPIRQILQILQKCKEVLKDE